MDDALEPVSDESSDGGARQLEQGQWCPTAEVDPWCPWTWRDFALPPSLDRQTRQRP